MEYCVVSNLEESFYSLELIAETVAYYSDGIEKIEIVPLVVSTIKGDIGSMLQNKTAFGRKNVCVFHYSGTSYT